MKLKPLQSETEGNKTYGKLLDILGVKVNSLSKDAVLKLGTQFMTSFKKHFIVTANSLLLLEAQKDPRIIDACRKADLIIPDSSGVSWAAMTLHLSRLTRYPGIDMAFELCRIAERHNSPVYLLGGKSGVSMDAARYLYRHYPNLQIAGMRDGFFQESDEAAIIEDIARSQSRLVLVALGMPRQELWISEKFKDLPPALYIGVGGTFDVWAGRVKRAPALFQHTGMEWLYRLGKEPKRWRRIAKLPKFALKVITKRF